MSQTETKDRILDAAEGLFARQGYRGTSLRALTTEAGVNLASVHYHFGGKEALLKEVLLRRLGPLSKRRQANLKRLRGEPGAAAPCVRDVLRAFMAPTFVLCEGLPNEGAFSLLIGRILAEPEEPGRSYFLELVRPDLELFYACLKRAFPALPEPILLWRMHFCLGAMSHALSLRTAAVPPGIRELFPPAASAGAGGHLVSFLAAALEAP